MLPHLWHPIHNIVCALKPDLTDVLASILLIGIRSSKAFKCIRYNIRPCGSRKGEEFKGSLLIGWPISSGVFQSEARDQKSGENIFNEGAIILPECHHPTEILKT